jgi:hypothetical protein
LPGASATALAAAKAKLLLVPTTKVSKVFFGLKCRSPFVVARSAATRFLGFGLGGERARVRAVSTEVLSRRIDDEFDLQLAAGGNGHGFLQQLR